MVKAAQPETAPLSWGNPQARDVSTRTKPPDVDQAHTNDEPADQVRALAPCCRRQTYQRRLALPGNADYGHSQDRPVTLPLRHERGNDGSEGPQGADHKCEKRRAGPSKLHRQSGRKRPAHAERMDETREPQQRLTTQRGQPSRTGRLTDAKPSDQTLVPQRSLPPKVGTQTRNDRLTRPVREPEVPPRASASTRHPASQSGRGSGLRSDASHAAAPIRALAAVGAPETNIDQEQVELEREQGVEKKQSSDLTAEVIRRRLASAGDAVLLCAQAQ
ncbi:MAG TPA: hypothetical protein VJX66_26290 [Amycolatopsis sp.]|nr:hypothetical protein [Amycolatopsis sp.]